jgi:hypothetical protein
MRKTTPFALLIYLADFHYISSTTTNNQAYMVICNANSHRVTAILLKNITKAFCKS